MNKNDLIHILLTTDEAELERIRDEAEATLLRFCGRKVYFRGLIEFSNRCDNDCFYCGIRKSNRHVNRYSLTYEQIVEAALWCGRQGYGSVVLQSGERRDEAFLSFVESVVAEIKEKSRSAALPDGLGITLSVGEQSRETYRRLFAAGAHRYLLRIETTNEALYRRLHPAAMRLDTRIEALHHLAETGFQVGTGVMIGLPGQTVDHLADDLLFFRQLDIDMIGMGPYIVHHDTPMARWTDAAGRSPEGRFNLGLRMIAAARLLLKDVNIAAATALQAIDPEGREKALAWGANIIMPQITPTEVRRNYQLYDGKPCLDESADMCRNCLVVRIKGADREIGLDSWGDSRHALQKRESQKI
jgi:biotin synthase